MFCQYPVWEVPGGPGIIRIKHIHIGMLKTNVLHDKE